MGIWSRTFWTLQAICLFIIVLALVNIRGSHVKYALLLNPSGITLIVQLLTQVQEVDKM